MTTRTILESRIREFREMQNMALRLGFVDDARHYVREENKARAELRVLVMEAGEET